MVKEASGRDSPAECSEPVEGGTAVALRLRLSTTCKDVELAASSRHTIAHCKAKLHVSFFTKHTLRSLQGEQRIPIRTINAVEDLIMWKEGMNICAMNTEVFYISVLIHVFFILVPLHKIFTTIKCQKWIHGFS